MPRKPSKSPKPKTKKASEGIAPTARVSEEPRGRGRPSGYDPEYAATAQKLYDKGWTDEEVAEFFEISVRTLYRWQVAHDELCQAIKTGKEKPDNRAERALYHRAVGFEWYEEQAIKVKDVEYENGRKLKESERVEVVRILKKVPPDTAASIFWLCNRRKDDWRQRQEHTGASGGPIEHNVGVSWMTEAQAKARGWA